MYRLKGNRLKAQAMRRLQSATRSVRRRASWLALAALLLVRLPALGAAAPEITAVVDAALLRAPAAFAPGGLATVFGRGLGGATAAAGAAPLPVEIGGARVLINGVAAPLLYASPEQINFQIPFETEGTSAEVTVELLGERSAAVTIPLAPAAPALFTLLGAGVGPAAMLHADSSLVGAEGVRVGEIVVLFASGLGAVAPPVDSGRPSPAAPLARTSAAIEVRFDSILADVLFSGLAPGFVGLYQINVRVPAGISSAAPAVRVASGSSVSPPASAGGPGALAVEPSALVAGTEQDIVLRGVNFLAGAIVEADGRELETAFLSAGELRARVPADVTANAEVVSFRVVQPAAGGQLAGNRIAARIFPADSLRFSRRELSFAAPACSSEKQSLQVPLINSAGAALPWTVSDPDSAWLELLPRGDQLEVRADPAGLAAGLHTAEVALESRFGSSLLRISLLVDAPDLGFSPVESHQVYVLDSMRRALRDDPPPRERAVAADLLAARNEYESFQIVVYGGFDGIGEADAEIAGPLLGPGCARIPARNIRLYREHYISVVRASNSGVGGARAGVYPDALIPFRNPFSAEPIGGGRITPRPFRVAAGRNQALYVEIYVPEDAAPGRYTGYVRVTRDGGSPLADVRIRLEVVDFALARAMSLTTQFQPFDHSHFVGPGRFYGYQEFSARHRSLAKAMDEEMIAHRLMPESPLGAGFEARGDGSLVLNPGFESRLEAWLSRPEYTGYRIRFWPGTPFDDPLRSDRTAARRYLGEAYRWLEERGFLPKVITRQFDEPSTTPEYIQVRDYADFVHQVEPGLRVALTDTFAAPQLATYVFGRVDILMMGYWAFDPLQAEQRQQAGDSIWTYTALAQNAERPTPFWLIDVPLFNYRVASWINARYGIVGLSYWTTDNWREIRKRGNSPWEDPCSYERDSCFNGDGLLVYPGREINYVVPRGAYGAQSESDVWGPVPSLRLKALRDGLEDYEWLTAAEKIDAQAVREIVIAAACRGDAAPGTIERNCFHNWNRDPAGVTEARRALAEILNTGGGK